MASKRITINTNAMGAAMVVTAMQNLDAAITAIRKAVTLANEVTGDGGVTTANLEGSPEFGVGAGQGATFYSNLNTIKANIDTASINNMIADMRQTS